MIKLQTIGIVGTRRRDTMKDKQKLKQFLIERGWNEDVVYVSGGCREGGDRFAEELAREFGLTMVTHYAKWKKNGKFYPSAGFKRNTFIARDSDILIAIVADDRTGGTEDTIEKFKSTRVGKWKQKLHLL